MDVGAAQVTPTDYHSWTRNNKRLLDYKFLHEISFSRADQKMNIALNRTM